MSDEWQKDRETCERATEGPWTYREPDDADSDDPYKRESYVKGPRTLPLPDTFCLEPNDARFIARARTRWPAALDRIAELEAEVRTAYARGFDDAKKAAVEAVQNCDGDEESMLTWTLACDAIRAVKMGEGKT